MNKKSIAGFVGLVAALAFATTAAAAFTTTLKEGSTGAEVKALQVALNGSAGTQVSATGAGSPGSETSYFGPKTKAAVIKFQINNDITPADGIVGASTRTALNAIGGGGAVVATPGTPAEVLCPNGMTLASNCAAAVVVASAALCPNGMTVASNCASAPAGASSTGEGSVTLSYDSAIANSLAVNRGEAGNVIGIKVKATGSDMKITRLWLDVGSRIWLFANKVELMEGSTVLGTIHLSASTVTEVTAGSQYKLEFNGLSFVVAKDATKVLVVRITRPTLTISNGNVTVTTTASSLRVVDGAGISETYPLVGGNRTLNLPAVTAGVGTLTNTLSTGTPSAQSVSGLSTTAGTLTAVKLMDFDLKAKDGAVNVTALSGTLSTAGDITQNVATIELRDGTTVLDSIASASTTSFAGLNIDIASGGTKTLSIWAKANHIASGYAVKGQGITAVVSSVTGTSGSSYASADSTTTVTGNSQRMFERSPTFALGTATALQVAGTTTGLFQGSYSLSFVVTASSGGDIFLNTASSTGATKIAEIGGTLASTISASGAVSKGVVLATWDKIAAGTSRTFTIVAQIPGGVSAGFTGVNIGNGTSTGLIWTDTDSFTSPVTQFWGLADIKTGTVYIN